MTPGPIRACFALGLLLLLSAPARGEEEGEPAGRRLPTVSAVGFIGPPNNAPIGGPSQHDLIVVGDVRRAGEGRATLTITETCYGASSTPSIELHRRRDLRDDELGPRVAILHAHHRKDVPWTVVKWAPASRANVLAARALGEARLRRLALGASLLFTGRELALSPRGAHVRTVEIERVLVGPQSLEGTLVDVRDRSVSTEAAQAIGVRTEPRIFFVGRDGPDADPPRREWDPPRPCFTAHTSLPASVQLETEVALLDRARLPIRMQRSFGSRRASRLVRKVVFLGPVADAIEMHETTLYDAWHLASVSLALRADEAREPLVAAIRERMVDHTVGAHGRHEPLRRLIRTLGRIEQRDPNGALDGLVEAYLDHLATRPAEPGPYDPVQGGEERRTDVNRALIRLLRAIGTDGAARHATRIRTLLSRSRPGWQRELRLALDVLAVDDIAELLVALERGKTLPEPVTRRIEERGRHADSLAFAHGRPLLAVGGIDGVVRLRDPSTWKGRDLPSLEDVEALAFSPDDRHLYVAGSGGARVQRHVVATGAVDRTYPGHVNRAEHLLLSPDGAVLATLGDKFGWLLFHDVETGQCLGREQTGGYGIRLAPTGCGVLVGRCDAAPDLYPFPTEPETPFVFPDGLRPMAFATTADGRWLCCANGHWSSQFADQPGDLVLYERVDGTYERRGFASDPDRHAFGHVAISASGRCVAVAGRHRALRVFTTPDLEEVGRLRFPRSRASDWTVEGLSFSSDEKYLAIGFSWTQTPGLVRLDSMQEHRPWTGHGDDVERLFQTSDGAEIRTIARDDAVCRWDARTLESRGRYRLPSGFESDAITPDGKRLLCAAMGPPDDPWPDWIRGRPARVLDAASGRVEHAFVLPERLARVKRWWLPGGTELLCLRDKTLTTLDVISGEVLRRVDAPKGWWSYSLEKSGTHLFGVGALGKGTRNRDCVRVDLATGASREGMLGEGRSLRARQAGLVPGGKAVWLAAPGLLVFDRETGAQLVQRALVDVEIEDVAPSPDGRHLALATRAPFPPTVKATLGSSPGCIVRIVETATGKTVLAFAPRSTVRKIRYTPDGSRLVLLGNDGTLSVWMLE